MSTEDKPGVDWNLIRRRILAGESAREIAKTSGISHVSIAKRARKRGWKPVNPNWKPETRKLETARIIADPQTHSDRKLVANGKRSPEMAERILDALHKGATQGIAAQAAGIGGSTLSQWMIDDPAFREQVRLAKGAVLTERVSEIVSAGKRGDWRASAHYLARHPDSREEWGDKPGGGAAVSISFNFERPAERDEPSSGQIIEAEIVDNRVARVSD